MVKTARETSDELGKIQGFDAEYTARFLIWLDWEL
jgi:hypothetical protein